MMNNELFDKAQEMGVISIDESGGGISYRLGRERHYDWDHPEEKVRAGIVMDLIFDYNYSPQRMDTEVSIPGRTPTNWADVVVFKDDRRKDPYITVETASPGVSESERSQKIEQLFGYANALGSEFAIYEDSASPRKFWRVRGYGGLEREANALSDIPSNYGNTPKYAYHRAGDSDLRIVDAAELARIFNRCHNALWAGGRSDPTESFDEMSKLIFAKLYDERRTRNGEAYGFQWGENETDIVVAQRALRRYRSALEEDPGIFSEDIHAEPNKIADVVRHLQAVSLSRTDPDAKGRAYEQFLGDVFRGRLGQYFTRREIVDCLVDILEPTNDDLILDPACGSGGFLVHAMKYVFQRIEEDYAGDLPAIFRLKSDFAQRNIHGIEINARIARVAMMDMVINEDGHTNIENHTALDHAFPSAAIRDGAYSLVLANPPFGDSVRADERDKLGQAELSDYTLSRGKNTAKSETLFVERCARFLRPGGRLGIVLPDGLLSNPSALRVRRYILDNFQISAVITLPQFAFRKAGSGMKTSLLIARKWADGEDAAADYPIFMAMADRIGYDSTGRSDDNDLPQIAAHFRNGTGGADDKIIRVRKSAADERLDPLYHCLGPVIDGAFGDMPYPAHSLRSAAETAIQSGKSPRGGAKYSDGDIPILLVRNITPYGALALDDLYYVDDEFFDATRDRSAIKPLDILIAKDGATTGKVGLVPQDFGFTRCLVSEHIFKLSVGASLPGDEVPASDELDARKELNAYYVFFFLKSWLGQQQIAREISGGAQGGITKAFVERIRIPISPLAERTEFVRRAREEYDAYLASAARAEEQYRVFQQSLSIR